MRRWTVILAAVLASACQLAGPPPLVQDGAGIFSPDARAAAEARLRAITAEHGVWTFVVTDPVGDPPRMLDESIDEADARGARAVAVLLGVDRSVGIGHSQASFAGADVQNFTPPGGDDLLAAGEADAALDLIVDYFEHWAASPPAGEAVPRFGGVEEPSGRPPP